MMQHEKKIYEKEEIKINRTKVKIIKQNENKKVKWEFLGMNNEFCEIIKKFLDDSHTKKLI